MSESNYSFIYITSPLNQFDIKDLLSINAPILENLHLSLTNIGLYLTMATFLVLLLNVLATNFNKLVSNS
jgi:F-type H+-transporting ATPase subunit a